MYSYHIPAMVLGFTTYGVPHLVPVMSEHVDPSEGH